MQDYIILGELAKNESVKGFSDNKTLMKKADAIKKAEIVLKNGGQTDGGCTFSPDFNFKKCCQLHDVMINHDLGITDREADRYLRECIADHGHPVKAWIYWLAVRYANIVGDHVFATVLVVFAAIVGAGIYFG